MYSPGAWAVSCSGSDMWVCFEFYDCLLFVVFFFSSRRRHTRSVSAFLLNRSSDLEGYSRTVAGGGGCSAQDQQTLFKAQIGRASCRARVEISVVAVSLKKKHRV